MISFAAEVHAGRELAREQEVEGHFSAAAALHECVDKYVRDTLVLQLPLRPIRDYLKEMQDDSP